MLSSKDTLKLNLSDSNDNGNTQFSCEDDYQLVKQAIKVLEGQKRKALNDISILQDNKRSILSDPIGYICKLRDGTAPILPLSQKVAKLPKHLRMQLRDLKNGSPPEKHFSNKPSSPQKYLSAVPSKKIWTKKDQQHLTKLLKTYPEEQSETERYLKIAKAMGNHSFEQISERVALIKNQDKTIVLPGFTIPIMLRDSFRGNENRKENKLEAFDSYNFEKEP